MSEETKGDSYGLLGEDVTPSVSQPPQPGAESAGPPITNLIVELQRNVDAQHALFLRNSRQWALYRETSAQPTAGGAVTFTLPKVMLGWEVELERIILSVGGASAAATVAVYRGGVHEGVLLDYSNAMLGNSPSRQVAEYNPPIRLVGNDQLVIVVAAAAAGTNQCYARAEGRQREL